MKAKIIALALFAFTAATVAFYPVFQGAGAHAKPPSGQFSHAVPVDPLATERPRLEVVFVLDTTGSMGGLIQAAKEKIWSIATTMASAQPAPEIRMGLVAYRDRGDAYVTRRVDLSEDLDSMYAALIDFQAAGGGDGPESVNQALHEAPGLLGAGQRCEHEDGASGIARDHSVVPSGSRGTVKVSRAGGGRKMIRASKGN